MREAIGPFHSYSQQTSHYRHISLCSPGSWTHASSSLRKQTMLVWVPLSTIDWVYHGYFTGKNVLMSKQGIWELQ